MHYCKLLLPAILFFSLSLVGKGQKLIQLDEGFKQAAIAYELKPQSHKDVFEMTSFSFDRYKVVDLKNNWEKNGFWTLYFKEKNIRRTTVRQRSGYSFQLIEDGKDTANVAVLFERSTPEGFLITSGSPSEELKFTSDVTTAYIQTTKGRAKWQLVLYEAPKRFLGTEWKAAILNDSVTIISKAIEQWNNGKKPAVTGLYGIGTAFYRGNQQIGAVQYPGTALPMIWLSKDLDEETHFVMAAVMEVLLLVATDLTSK